MLNPRNSPAIPPTDTEKKRKEINYSNNNFIHLQIHTHIYTHINIRIIHQRIDQLLIHS